MHTADIVILIALVLPGIVGIIYGFLNLVFSFVAWALALGISAKFGSLISPMLATFVDSIFIRDILAFIGLFIVSLMIFSLMGHFIVKLLGRAGLTATDRILGFIFGVGLAGFIIFIVVFLLGFTDYPDTTWWKDAVLIEPFQHIAVWGHQFLPDNIAEYHSY